jgi:hypothetical protein
MRASLGKTARNHLGIVFALPAASLLVLLGSAASASPLTHVTGPVPGVPRFLGHGEGGVRPDTRVPDAFVAPARYVVGSGDTLSGIADSHLGGVATWIDLWHANLAAVPDPDLIHPGLALTLPTGHVAGPAVPVRVVNTAYVTPTRPVARHVATVGVGTSRVNVSGYVGFQACVIRRESSGNPRAVNPSSGAGGLYGFLPSTWRGLGFSGLPENASVSVQDAAFAKEFAADGVSPWRPYDGC